MELGPIARVCEHLAMWMDDLADWLTVKADELRIGADRLDRHYRDPMEVD